MNSTELARSLTWWQEPTESPELCLLLQSSVAEIWSLDQSQAQNLCAVIWDISILTSISTTGTNTCPCQKLQSQILSVSKQMEALCTKVKPKYKNYYLRKEIISMYVYYIYIYMFVYVCIYMYVYI